MKLTKLGYDYKLYGDDDSCIATTKESPYKKLSKKNCDEIFGVVNVEKFAEDFVCDIFGEDKKEIDLSNGAVLCFITGFNKAMELNKDKLFTVENIRKAYQKGEEDSYTQGGLTKQKEDNYIQSLQQPTEIEVEILMGTLCRQIDCVDAARLVESKIVKDNEAPMLDKDGCLILKRI